jgi:lysozyme family protein
MSEFGIAVEYVLENEGGLTDNVQDAGGITKYGISYRFLRELDSFTLQKFGIFGELTYQSVRDLTIDQAHMIYKDEFWAGNNFEEIESQQVCNYVFDMVVNHGQTPGIKMVQRSIWAATKKDFVKDDGFMREPTIGALNSLGEALIPLMMATRAQFCRELVALKAPNEMFLDGWLTRCYRGM